MLSANGLCVECSKAVETSRPAGTPLEDQTRTVLHDFGTATRTGPDVGGDTKTWNGQAKLRPAPAGYDLYRYLGGGGMGDVYLAREHAAERTVAIKFLRAASHPASAERFLTEVRALAKLDHPNIVRIISVDLDRVDPHFTMDYVGAGTLSELVKSEGPMPPTEAAKLARSLATALNAAHGAEILHRDIKPSNVLIAPDGTPKISDFGLAKRMDFDEGLTYSTQPLGTPSFMPPEQVSRESGVMGPQADVYGLGATLYFMLTGAAPFEDANPESIMKRVRFDPPPRPRSLKPGLPIELEAIVLKCLEKKPEDRYASAAELAADLDRFLAGGVPAAPQLTPVRRAKKWLVRNRVAIGSALALAIAAAIIYELVPPADPQEQIQRKLQDGKRVVIVPERGMPKSGEWVFTPSTLAESVAKDGTPSFQTNGTTLYQLVRDPGIERYRITAEIRQMGADRPPAGRALPDAFVGMYCGFDMQAGPPGKFMNCLTALKFVDIEPVPLPKDEKFPNRAPERPGVQVGLAAFSQQPENPTLVPSWSHSSKTPFVPNPLSWPGHWRGLRFDVTPEGITAYWSATGAGGDFVEVQRLAAESIQSQYRSLADDLKSLVPGVVPQWRPRAALGVMAFRSTIAFHNVSIEPLP
ncbi:MAG: serine/threonine-protein kinase [Gemmataceae bacterium]